MVDGESFGSSREDAPRWHALEAEEVFDRIESAPEGLSSGEAERRLAAYGPNRLRQVGRRSNWSLLLSQFKNVLIYVLLAASAVTLLIGHYVDSAVIFGVVLLNALIGFLQEGKAEKALDAIRNLLTTRATTLRDGRQQVLDSEQLVPGDVVLIQAGDKVPADIRLFRSRELRIDESALTGESVPVSKIPERVEARVSLGDRRDMAFSGTLVATGQGRGVVVATGNATELGRISTLIATVPPVATRLLVKMAEFSRRLTVTIGVVAIVVLTFGILVRSYDPTDMFLAAVGLAVAAIPEGLPAILTITLAVGVQRMASRNAVIRRLPSVETLGSVTVICSDKTGTLTRNQMTVRTVTLARDRFEVSGQGYNPEGTFANSEREEFSCLLYPEERVRCHDYPELMDLARAGLCCNDASLEQSGDTWQVQGGPTEGALIVLARKAGLDCDAETEGMPRVDAIPFSSEHRYMATLHLPCGGGAGRIYVKGAPEKLLPMCERQRSGEKTVLLDTPYWQQMVRQIARQGQRTLALASKEAAQDMRSLDRGDVEQGLVLLGVVGIIDPPRADAVNAVAKCRAAGITIKMITGDHALTALAVGEQMGIGDGVTAVSGEELDALSEERLREIARQVEVFARVSPESKLRLVRALQADGEVVAMTGDGVNDAPALKQADVGIAMGLKGTETSKEAAEMVLADDNFASISNAVEEGRTVYDNIKKSIAFILPTNGGQAGIIVAAILLGRVLPITPVQILWVNMVTAVTLALALTVEPAEPGVMARPPRDPKEPLLTRHTLWRISFVALIMVLGVFGLFLFELSSGAPLASARTVAVNTVVAFEIFYLFNSRFLLDSALSRRGFFGSGYALLAIIGVIALQAGFTYAAPMQHLFDSAAIGPVSWARILLVASSVLVLVELEKRIVRTASSGRGQEAR